MPCQHQNVFGCSFCPSAMQSFAALATCDSPSLMCMQASQTGNGTAEGAAASEPKPSDAAQPSGAEPSLPHTSGAGPKKPHPSATIPSVPQSGAGHLAKLPLPESDAEHAALPRVEGQPQPGDLVAYKLLEIGADWAPQVQ